MLSSDFFTVLREPYLSWLLQGLVLTFALFAYSWVIAFFLGLVLLLMRMSPVRPITWIPTAYVELAQNVPLLVQAMFWYFAVPLMLADSLQQAINRGSSEFILAGLALGCCLAAYFSESLRSGVRAINSTQFEASRALGFNFLQTMRYIILPQAIRETIPPLLNNTLLLFKNTSIAMIIGVHEFMYQIIEIDTETFRTFDTYLVATVVYLSISTVIMILGDWVERRAKRGRRNPVG